MALGDHVDQSGVFSLDASEGEYMLDLGVARYSHLRAADWKLYVINFDWEYLWD